MAAPTVRPLMPLCRRHINRSISPAGPLFLGAGSTLHQTPSSSPTISRPYSSFPPAKRRQLLQLSSTRRWLSTSTRRTNAEVRDDVAVDINAIEREKDEVDVCIVGAGPAGLSTAIKLRQLALANNNPDFRVLVLEKAPTLGAHILSGNVLDPSSLNALLPDWLSSDNPNAFQHATLATKDRMRWLTSGGRSLPLPTPPQMHNAGRNYILSLNELVAWMGERAEELGVEIYPGFAGAEVLFRSGDGAVEGVATNDLGVGRDGKPKSGGFERGMEFRAPVTIFAEGCRGSLTKKVVQRFGLRSPGGGAGMGDAAAGAETGEQGQEQTYGLGVKEVWEVRPEVFRKGEVTHSMGWPLDKDTYGGGWMYHFGENLVSVGMVVGLDYPNPWLSPYGEFQRMKTHPLYRDVLAGGNCVSYGARALNEGGWQSIPKCAFPGGALVGDSAGFLNVPKIKGTHTSMLSGILAAEATWNALTQSREGEGSVFLFDYEDKLRESSIWKELYEVRNMRPSFHSPLGVYGGIMYSGLEAFLFRGKTPWTLKHAQGGDHGATKPAAQTKKIEYAKPDGEVTFDILTSVSRTGTNHEEDQPCHLQVPDWGKHRDENWPLYQGLENRFCPAGVYEYVDDPKEPYGKRFQINAQNCIHCKTCDIKAPKQDINWQTPQGGEGPKYIMT